MSSKSNGLRKQTARQEQFAKGMKLGIRWRFLGEKWQNPANALFFGCSEAKPTARAQ
jgi:hypothetical protein